MLVARGRMILRESLVLFHRVACHMGYLGSDSTVPLYVTLHDGKCTGGLWVRGPFMSVLSGVASQTNVLVRRHYSQSYTQITQDEEHPSLDIAREHSCGMSETCFRMSMGFFTSSLSLGVWPSGSTNQVGLGRSLLQCLRGIHPDLQSAHLRVVNVP